MLATLINRCACLGLAALLMLSARANATAQSTHTPPMNVIVVMTDEHNFRTLGCYRKQMEQRQAYMWGPAVVETPNIDWLAQEGALCNSFYATTPVCSPSRAALVSGLYPQATPVVTNNIPLRDDLVTFAEILAGQGYQTGYAGKWHLDGAGKPQWAPERKFGFQDNRYMFNRGHWKKLEMTDAGPRVGAKNKQGQPSYDVGGADETTFTTDFLTDRAIEFVHEHRDRPFCYMLSLPDPHGPDTVRAPYDTMYADQTYEKPTTFDVDPRTVPQWGQPDKRGGFGQSKYYGMVKCIDDNLGRLLAALREDKILDRTIIIFTSDHGDLRGEHHRQNKGVAFEGSARVPFLVHAPGKVTPGMLVQPALTSVDFAPTLMSWLEVETDVTFHGRDASALFDQQRARETDWQDIAFVRGTQTGPGWLMAVNDRYKLVLSTSDRPWLFDLQRDPDELINQLDNPAYRTIIQEMGQQLQDYVGTYEDPRGQQPEIKRALAWAVSGKGPYPDGPAAK